MFLLKIGDVIINFDHVRAVHLGDGPDDPVTLAISGLDASFKTVMRERVMVPAPIDPMVFIGEQAEKLRRFFQQGGTDYLTANDYFSVMDLNAIPNPG